MKRKVTTLEQNLINKGFRLEKKTYIGKNRDKVNTYVYSFSDGEITYFVELDKTRTKIIRYYFTNKCNLDYTHDYITKLETIYNDFGEKLHDPFVEESGFDD